jgi:hypothetical protein
MNNSNNELTTTEPEKTSLNLKKCKKYADFEKSKGAYEKLFCVLLIIMSRQYNRWKSNLGSKTLWNIHYHKILFNDICRLFNNDKMGKSSLILFIKELDIPEIMKCFRIPKNSTEQEKNQIKKDKKSTESLLNSISSIKKQIDNTFNEMKICKKN